MGNQPPWLFRNPVGDESEVGEDRVPGGVWLVDPWNDKTKNILIAPNIQLSFSHRENTKLPVSSRPTSGSSYDMHIIVSFQSNTGAILSSSCWVSPRLHQLHCIYFQLPPSWVSACGGIPGVYLIVGRQLYEPVPYSGREVSTSKLLLSYHLHTPPYNPQHRIQADDGILWSLFPRYEGFLFTPRDDAKPFVITEAPLRRGGGPIEVTHHDRYPQARRVTTLLTENQYLFTSSLASHAGSPLDEEDKGTSKIPLLSDIKCQMITHGGKKSNALKTSNEIILTSWPGIQLPKNGHLPRSLIVPHSLSSSSSTSSSTSSSSSPPLVDGDMIEITYSPRIRLGRPYSPSMCYYRNVVNIFESSTPMVSQLVLLILGYINIPNVDDSMSIYDIQQFGGFSSIQNALLTLNTHGDWLIISVNNSRYAHPLAYGHPPLVDHIPPLLVQVEGIDKEELEEQLDHGSNEWYQPHAIYGPRATLKDLSRFGTRFGHSDTLPFAATPIVDWFPILDKRLYGRIAWRSFSQLFPPGFTSDDEQTYDGPSTGQKRLSARVVTAPYQEWKQAVDIASPAYTWNRLRAINSRADEAWLGVWEIPPPSTTSDGKDAPSLPPPGAVLYERLGKGREDSQSLSNKKFLMGMFNLASMTSPKKTEVRLPQSLTATSTSTSVSSSSSSSGGPVVIESSPNPNHVPFPMISVLCCRNAVRGSTLTELYYGLDVWDISISNNYDTEFPLIIACHITHDVYVRCTWAATNVFSLDLVNDPSIATTPGRVRIPLDQRGFDTSRIHIHPELHYPSQYESWELSSSMQYGNDDFFHPPHDWPVRKTSARLDPDS